MRNKEESDSILYIAVSGRQTLIKREPSSPDSSDHIMSVKITGSTVAVGSGGWPSVRLCFSELGVVILMPDVGALLPKNCSGGKYSFAKTRRAMERATTTRYADLRRRLWTHRALNISCWALPRSVRWGVLCREDIGNIIYLSWLNSLSGRLVIVKGPCTTKIEGWRLRSVQGFIWLTFHHNRDLLSGANRYSEDGGDKSPRQEQLNLADRVEI